MNRALLIGIDAYATQAALAGCGNDARDLAQLLRSHDAVDARNLVVLADRDATKPAIVQELIALVAALEPNDRGYVHFSGHGVRMPCADASEPDGMEEALCPHDFDWTPQTALTALELLAILADLDLGARLLLSIDACYAGDFLRGNGLRGRPRTLTPPPGSRTRGPTLHGFCAAARAPNVSFVAACSAWQISSDVTFDGRVHGAFSYHLVRALATTGRTATLDDVIAAIEHPLRAYAVTPVAENAAIPYLPPPRPSLAAALASPLRIAPPPARPDVIVFEQHWTTSLLDQPIELGVRIATTDGALSAVITAHAFGRPLTSSPIHVTGELAVAVQLGLSGVHAILAISAWTHGGGAIEFTLELDLANSLPFVPQRRIARVPIRVCATQLTREAAALRAGVG